MSWTEISKAFHRLAEARDAGRSLRPAWDDFVEAAQATGTDPPYHMRLIVGHAKDLAAARSRGDIAILDHGCGGGLPTLYLIALGFTKAIGLNVAANCLVWNGPLKEVLPDDDDRFLLYDGNRIPLGDNSVDMVFSQQVLEHVNDSVLEAFYREEGRILKPGSVAIHQVPHRLVPYDTHSKTWLVHWLPRMMHPPVHRILGAPAEHLKQDLFLRSPFLHMSLAKRFLGPTTNKTKERILTLTTLPYYDGPRRSRKLVAVLSRLPLVGALFASMLSFFMMLETVSRKP